MNNEPYDDAIDLGVPVNVTNGKAGTVDNRPAALSAASETTTGGELAVPDRAIVELNAWTDDALAPSDRYRAAVAIAAPVVAAELRRHAEKYREWSEQSGGPWSDALRGVATGLTQSADEWDGGQ